MTDSLKFKLAPAYWILPDGQVLEVTTSHIQKVIERPADFGLTIEYIRERYAACNEQMPVEGLARAEIIKLLVGQNFIRLRDYHTHWSINISRPDESNLQRLQKWAVRLNTLRNARFEELVIDSPGNEAVRTDIESLLKMENFPAI